MNLGVFCWGQNDGECAKVSKKRGPSVESELELKHLIQTRLIRERERAELSQTELAKLSGLSLSFVKLIENGKSTPTVVSTWRYLAGCGKTLGDFFIFWLPSVPVYQNRAVHRQIQMAMKTKEGAEHIKMLLKLLDNRSTY